jgi:hypothetical protein
MSKSPVSDPCDGVTTRGPRLFDFKVAPKNHSDRHGEIETPPFSRTARIAAVGFRVSALDPTLGNLAGSSRFDLDLPT